MKPAEMNLLAARIIGECTIAYLKSKPKSFHEGDNLKWEISYFMEKYGANEDQY